MKKALTPAGSSSSDLNLGAVIFAGGAAGVCMWSIAIPPDVRERNSEKSYSRDTNGGNVPLPVRCCTCTGD